MGSRKTVFPIPGGSPRPSRRHLSPVMPISLCTCTSNPCIIIRRHLSLTQRYFMCGTMRDVFTQKQCGFQGIRKKSLMKGGWIQGLRGGKVWMVSRMEHGAGQRVGTWARAALANLTEGRERPRTAVGLSLPSHRRAAPAVFPQFTAE